MQLPELPHAHRPLAIVLLACIVVLLLYVARDAQQVRPRLPRHHGGRVLVECQAALQAHEEKRGLVAARHGGAQNSFVIIGYGLSLCVGIFTWWWMGVEYGKDVLGNNDMWGDHGPTASWPKFMIFVMALMLIAPAAAMAIIIIVAMAVGDSIHAVLDPVVLRRLLRRRHGLLLLADGERAPRRVERGLCVHRDRQGERRRRGRRFRGKGRLYALVQGEIAEEVKALKEGGEEVPEFGQWPSPPQAAAGGAAEMARQSRP